MAKREYIMIITVEIEADYKITENWDDEAKDVFTDTLDGPLHMDSVKVTSALLVTHDSNGFAGSRRTVEQR